MLGIISETTVDLHTHTGRIERQLTVQNGRNTPGRRQGALNYSEEELTKLLDIVEDHEPLGANMWALVHQGYKFWAFAARHPEQDADIVQHKFYRLSNTNHSTGNPTSPPNVRQAKRIAKSILNRAQAVSLGVGRTNSNDIDDDDNSVSTNRSDASLP